MYANASKYYVRSSSIISKYTANFIIVAYTQKEINVAVSLNLFLAMLNATR